MASVTPFHFNQEYYKAWVREYTPQQVSDYLPSQDAPNFLTDEFAKMKELSMQL